MNNQMLLYPLLFEPNLHTVVWGGGQLRPPMNRLVRVGR